MHKLPMASDIVTPGLVIASRYQVERQLGEGGMGSVFLVQHVHTDEQLALKVLHSAVVKDSVALERFKREARTPARINSDHVVRVTDADVSPELGNVPFLVMEYLRGQDLDQLLTARGRLPPTEVVLYLRQAARALDKAHALGIIHRDLKPENLFLTAREDGTPLIKLLDFGIAKLTGAAGELARKGAATSTGQIFGTPLFMSPEQALAESAKISPQTDVWALGLIAHKMLTGADIWTATTLTHLVAQIAYEPMPVPTARGSTFGPLYDAWFATCCARDVENRYKSAGDAVSELARALGVPEMSMTGTGTLQDSGPIRLAALTGRGPNLTPVERGISLAATTDVGSSQPGGALKQSAGPLTRTDLHLGTAGGKKRGLGIAVGILGLGVGAAIAIWLYRDHPTAPVVAAGSAAVTSTEGAAAVTTGAASSTASPVVAPGTEAPATSAAPSASADASAAPAISTAPQRPVAGRPPGPRPSAGGGRPPTPAAGPSTKPTAPPIDPLSGRQ